MTKNKRRGGKPRKYKKMSPTMKFLSINQAVLGTKDWKLIKDVPGYNPIPR